MNNLILSGNEVSLAVEGRTTNLRVWTSKNDDTVYFRLEKHNQYNAPLSNESVNYLEKDNKEITKLNALFGFNRATKKDIDTIVDILKGFKFRACKDW